MVKSGLHKVNRMGIKMLITLLIVATTIVTFGALGDGSKKSSRFPKKSNLLSGKTFTQNTFTLKSGYTYRGNQVLSTPSSNLYINMNTVVTYQKGNRTYIVPLKKRVILDKVNFQLGNRQFLSN